MNSEELREAFNYLVCSLQYPEMQKGLSAEAIEAIKPLLLSNSVIRSRAGDEELVALNYLLRLCLYKESANASA